MRRAAIVASLLALAAAAPLAAAPRCSRAACARADADLHINQLQVVGTAESAKQVPGAKLLHLIAMGGKKDVEALNFGQPPIGAQLDLGARALSFDIAYDPQGGLFKSPAGASMADELLDPAYIAAMTAPGFKVIHVLDVDYRSSCIALHDCLRAVADWSRAHRDHLPIFIVLRANDTKTPMPGGTKPLAFGAAAMDALESEISAVFKPSEIIAPSQVKGGQASLRQGVVGGGWPRLGAARGKVIFVYDGAGKPAAAAESKLIFATADESSPLAAFIAIDNPLKDQDRIAADVRAGFIVLTRADEDTREARANDTTRRDAAFASGAQIVLTDFLVPDAKIGSYQVRIPDPRHAQCDVMLPADRCAAWNSKAGRTLAAR